MLKKDLGLLVLILVVGAVVAHHQPALPLADQHRQHRQPGRPVRHLRHRPGLRHHHRRHRAFGRLDDRAARRASSSISSPTRACRGRSRSLIVLVLGFVMGLAARPADHQAEAAALRRDALRPADLSRRRALLHRGRHGRLPLRRQLPRPRVADRPAAPTSSRSSPAAPCSRSRSRTPSSSCS